MKRAIDYVRTPPDFSSLSEEYPIIKEYILSSRKSSSLTTAKEGEDAKSEVIQLDWKNPNTLLAITSALLHRDFGIDFSLPDGFLCPPLPQRLSYLHWAADLLSLLADAKWQHSSSNSDSDSDSKNQNDNNSNVVCLDVGIGASMVLSVLAVCVYGWRSVGSEINRRAVEAAEKLMEKNEKLQGKIVLRHVVDGKSVLDGVMTADDVFHVSVCNPPFFDSLAKTRLNPHRAASTVSEELVCEGGEEKFIGRMIRESWQFRHQVGWFTTMLGKKSSLSPLQKAIRQLEGVQCVKTTIFEQGRQAML
jgi:23S rRNA (adenine1618-N6)-methyltransferase